MRKLTLGVLGLGEGRSVISAAQTSDYWQIGNVCDLDESLCRERVEEFGLNGFTTSYEAMLKDKNIDVIGIYTPDQLHYKHIRMALEAGKHVICTKPLMTSLEQGPELLKVQQKSGKHVFVGQSSRYFEPAIRQRQDYLNNKHGQLVMLETHYITDARWFLDKPWSKAPGFSWMYNFLIHAVDLALWYLPDIEFVYGTGYVSENTKAYGLDIPDSISFILTAYDGRSAVVKGVYAEPTLGADSEQSISCTLRGIKGISRAGYPRLVYETKFDCDGALSKRYRFDELHDYYFRFEGESHHAGEYQNYIDEFAQKLNEGKAPTPDLREGLKTLAVMEGMERSLGTGERVYIQEVLKEHKL